ncbi:MAG: hypothetical protein ACI9TH_004251 [Kiritimatiellia bacterium]|jgi:uncharacterized protein YbjQ (UPF0145 family)
MFELITFLVLLGLGWFVGRTNERRHYKSIVAREAASLNRPALSFDAEQLDTQVASGNVATGSVVISIDYFKQFMSSFRMIFGGEMKSYASLIDRARREALLRMKESCPDADLYLNTRLETSSISQGAKDRIGCIEIVAYSTAVKLTPS